MIGEIGSTGASATAGAAFLDAAVRRFADAQGAGASQAIGQINGLARAAGLPEVAPAAAVRSVGAPVYSDPNAAAWLAEARRAAEAAQGGRSSEAPQAPSSAAPDGGSGAPAASNGPNGTLESAPPFEAPTPSGDGLTEGEREVVEELKARDREVRAHEQAHAQVGGQYAGAPTYEYEVGPDNQRYAVAGQVEIDVSPVQGDPEATIEKMEIVKRAALAPAEPSSADRQVAATADAIRGQAMAELAAQKAAERRGEAEPGAAWEGGAGARAVSGADDAAADDGAAVAAAAQAGYGAARAIASIVGAVGGGQVSFTA